MISVVFDLDGTLIDSAQAIRKIANQLMAEHGLKPLTGQETRSFIGAGAAMFVRRAFAARAIEDPPALEAAIARFERYYAEADPLDNLPMPGADAALAALTGSGCALGLCTNKPGAPTEAVIKALGWSERLSVVIAGDSLSVRKPDPEPLLEAGRRLGGQPLLYVGDSEVDAETAARAGTPLLLYTEGYRAAPVETLPHRAAFSDFAELPDLVRAAAAEFSR
ncbi:MAG: phosphoglycolate phosphatase [Pseudomonadota bacterium]